MVKKSRTSKRLLTVSEIGAVKKSWKGRMHIALVYPNTYPVGMSNLGFHAIYQLLNKREDVLCERVFLPEDHPSVAASIRSLESGRPMSDFDIVAFSLSFENDYPHVLTLLDKAGIPHLSADREDPLPLVMAGGVACFLNPEPLADFFDFFMIGEAEALFPSFFEHFDPGLSRKERLKALAQKVLGVYVPSFYHVRYSPEGILNSFEPVMDVPPRIKRVFAEDLSQVPTYSGIISPHAVFSNTFLVEVARGCPHGCRFCSAGYVYRPYRFQSYELLKGCLAKGESMTDKIGLVGATFSSLTDIYPLCRQMIQRGTHFSFSSLRADRLTGDMLSVLKSSGVKTATLAPDAGSQRMRDMINKGIEEDDILHGTEVLVETGIPNLRLYFMIGLPEEKKEDVDAIVALTKKVKRRFLDSSRKKARIGNITISVSSFVPKPSTPFQWVSMNKTAEIKQKIQIIRRGLSQVANVHIHVDSPRWSYIQALLSRGDRRVSRLLRDVHRSLGNWGKILRSSPSHGDFFALRERNFDELLPWDFIDHGFHKDFLINEYKRAIAGEKTPPCDIGSCTICGVCKKRT